MNENYGRVFTYFLRTYAVCAAALMLVPRGFVHTFTWSAGFFAAYFLIATAFNFAFGELDWWRTAANALIFGSINAIIQTMIFKYGESAYVMVPERDKEIKKEDDAFLRILVYVANTLGYVICAYLFFFAACLVWSWIDPAIFTQKASVGDVALYVIDMIVKALCFDVLEHFGWNLSNVQHATSNLGFSLYTFAFRLFTTFVVIELLVIFLMGDLNIIRKRWRRSQKIRERLSSRFGDAPKAPEQVQP